MNPSRRRFWVTLALIALGGLAVRVVYVLVWRRHPEIGGDTEYYQLASNLLADGKGFLNPFFSTPGHPYQSADHPPLYQLYLALGSLLGLRGPLAHELWSVLLGAWTVPVAGLAGREIAGRRTGLVAAAIVAVYPDVWAWDGMIMSETMAIFTATLTLWLAYRYWRRPSFWGAVALGLGATLATMSRAELSLLFPFVVLPLLLATPETTWRARLERLGAAGLVAIVIVGPWVGYNLSRFRNPVYLSVGFDIALSSSSCEPAYYGRFLGFWAVECPQRVRDEIAVVESSPAWQAQRRREHLPLRLDQSEETPYFHRAAFDYIRAHKARTVVVMAARLGRVFGVYRPWQQANLQWFVGGLELWIARANLFSWYLLVPFAVYGVVVLRRRRVPVYPLLAVIATVVIAVAITIGVSRYRASAETAVALLAAVGVDALLRRRWPGPETDESGAEPAVDAPGQVAVPEGDAVGAQ